MKKHISLLSVFAAIFISLLSMSCSKDKDEIANTDWSQFQSQVLLLPIQELSDSERANLLFVREEEKLARDVYQTLYKKWGRNIFGNIASSEQTHMDAILILLDKYQIPDPASGKNVGEFSNASLQQLYFNLVNLGNNSLPDALKVGATIEDLDIFDIKSMMLETDNQDVLLVFSNLTKGSRNHLRSFYKNILNVGGEYDAQYISQTELEAIVNSPMETGW